uniref:Uncharacterized protein n=1 Tax=Physcomitrium patens TaxID=3218 RepID=A0A2K1L1V2_PHYPA|nr:hypothetical protein PHYPA_002783 [Physcomitrium patens]
MAVVQIQVQNPVVGPRCRSRNTHAYFVSSLPGSKTLTPPIPSPTHSLTRFITKSPISATLVCARGRQC